MRTAKKKTTNNNKQKQKPVGVTWQKKNKKKHLCICSTLFGTLPCRCCCNVKLPSYTLYGENVVCARKKFCCLCSCSLFFTAPHFCLTVRSQFLFHSGGVSCCSSKEIRLLCFLLKSLFQLSVGLQFSLSSPSFHLLSCFLFLSLSLPSRGAMQFPAKTSRVVFGLPYLLIELHVSYTGCLWCRRTGVRSRDYKSLPKFLGCMDNQIFLPIVLRH